MYRKDMLKTTFFALLDRFSVGISQQTAYWNELSTTYGGSKRAYHNLTHLENMLHELQATQHAIQTWDALLFALYYHDFVYEPLLSDNEEKSAQLAAERMTALGISPETIELSKETILATKTHLPHPTADINYFTDADLAILGQPWEVYAAYADNVRKEYALVPSLLYRRGRKKVLQHFLATESVFKTTHFRYRYETAARENIRKELSRL